MATLTAESKDALDRLRAYKPPPTIWQDMPLSRKAAVLILLFADQKGDLRVVVTMRASSLSSYSGQAALPGGKAEQGESAWECARREASEEIGLPQRDDKIPKPFRIEHLTEMPTNLAKTELVVRPCIAFLHSYDENTGQSANAGEQLLPRLDAREVAAVFSLPLKNLLYKQDLPNEPNLPGKPSDWYRGSWTDWHQHRWRMHNFFVPVTNQNVTKPKRTDTQKAAADHLEGLERYRVFGMTARILTDAARQAYAQEPEFEHNSHFGDEDMIKRLQRLGRLGEIRKRGEELTGDILRKAANL
ncbi:8-oxo-dGTP diphosphatase [Lithohypha guttulata]|uniref:8-oxo-dGTP diphosphatase n=1 Tax=Lithohypha guttulata TaxID=1690604 RepID=UPI002DE0D271|nr:8-oxo-dGTP diphosphatase [Lithohypha guttulata]KAK5099715.1 8-oxo-dGTP diphosphatase [Lithohypha guttulata]